MAKNDTLQHLNDLREKVFQAQDPQALANAHAELKVAAKGNRELAELRQRTLEGRREFLRNGGK
jgi:hypothetical protein